MCEAAFPTGVDKSDATLVLVINIFFPGLGTMIAACMGDCRCGTIAVGLCQTLTSLLIVGWIWGIVWSVNLRKHVLSGDGKGFDASAPPMQGAAPQPPPPAL